jgi:hypothetical protein
MFLMVALLLQGCGGASRRLAPSPMFKNPEIEASYKEGEAAMLGGDYVRARRVFMQIISRFPGENDLAQIQWSLARTYDLEGRPAAATSEYKRFLANFPDHPNATDAEDRIRFLEQAARPRAARAEKPVRVLGTLSTDYEYAKETRPIPVTTLNRFTARLDAQVRNLDAGRGKVVISALRTFEVEDSRNDRERLQKLFGDWHNQAETFSVRAGRQSATAGLLSTRYDGVEAHYRPSPALALDAAAGFPVDFVSSGAFSTDRRFYEAGVSLTDFWHTTGRLYAIRQDSDGVPDRKAVGANLQGVWGPLGVTGNVDYEVQFGAFNDRFLSLDYALTEQVHVTLGHDVRKDPFFQMSTALQDPAALGVTSLGDLVALLGEPAVRDLVELHTIDSQETRLGLRMTLGPHWTSSADLTHVTSDLVDTTGTHTQRTINSASLYAGQANAWRIPDTASVLAIYQGGTDLSIATLSLTAGQRFGAVTRGQLKGRVDYSSFKKGIRSDSLRYTPGVLLTVEPTRSLSFTAEGEYSWDHRFYEASRTGFLSRLNVTVAF